ncbi:COQ9 family protein [Novosphingobium sp.]|uniref:COQ9 family protein n=1 Tax=Novosphingobium sp. TaxID=1874826 RepID=UPI002736A991|nr:COQ9 family protein [Novosphingobium sp.]MDP3905589.1 COQ9 family protein [Novosphingobium sp.]
MGAAADSSLDAMRLALAPAIADAATFDGWSEAAVRAAAQQVGLDPDAALFAFPGGAMDMIAGWVAAIDADMAAAFPAEKLAAMKIRERIRSLVQFRLDAIAWQQEALRRALAIMAMPQNAPRALQLGWHSADAMWRLAGDSSVDYNYYTKRTILAGIYGATLAVYADDKSEDCADTRAFLDRRIDGIMRFEKAKAKWLNPDREHFSPARLLGRLRYPAR